MRRYPLHIIIWAFLLLPAPLLAKEAAPRMPTFAQCQALANPKTAIAEKAQLTQLFKTNNLFCSMASAPFQVQYVFSSGQSKSQLRLMMGKKDRYEIDGKSLLDVLLPDRRTMPPAQMIMLAGQIIGFLGEIFSSDINPHTITHVRGKAAALMGIAGVNARTALAQLEVLRGQAHLDVDAIEPSFWLTRLSRLEAPPPTQTQSAAPAAIGPAWMQKLMGAGQNLMGTFTGGGE